MTSRAHKALKITGVIVLILLTFALESCIAMQTGRFTLIDLGGALAEPGQMRPELHYEKRTEQNRPAISPTKLWKKGDNFVIEVPIAFIPARYSIFVHAVPSWRYLQKTHKTLGYTLYTREKAETWEYPTELYYAELTLEQVRILLRNKKSDHVFPPPPGLENVKLIPAARYDLSGAALIYNSSEGKALNISKMAEGKSSHGFSGIPKLWKLDIDSIPPRRTWYNRCLQPLSWCAEVVDIPLSMLATPIGWLADAIYESLNN